MSVHFNLSRIKLPRFCFAFHPCNPENLIHSTNSLIPLLTFGNQNTEKWYNLTDVPIADTLKNQFSAHCHLVSQLTCSNKPALPPVSVHLFPSQQVKTNVSEITRGCIKLPSPPNCMDGLGTNAYLRKGPNLFIHVVFWSELERQPQSLSEAVSPLSFPMCSEGTHCSWKQKQFGHKMFAVHQILALRWQCF